MAPLDDNAIRASRAGSALGNTSAVTARGTVGTGGVNLPTPETAAVTTVTISANTTFHTPAPVAGRRISVLIKQDATGSRTGTFSTTHGGYVHFPGGTHTLSTVASDTDRVDLACLDGVGWVGTLAKALA